MKRLLLILTGLSVVIVLLSVNRLTALTASYLAPHEFLRWLDFNAMIPIPLVSILLYWLLLREVGGGRRFVKTRTYAGLLVVFLTGVYLFGASSGVHEVTNYLNSRFCQGGIAVPAALCPIIVYNDDEFSHLVYYVGFVLMNVALLVTEFCVPRRPGATGAERAAVVANAALVGVGIFANLAFEQIGVDLYFFGSMMALALVLLGRRGWKVASQPALLYFAVAYSLGVVGTLGYKLLVG